MQQPLKHARRKRKLSQRRLAQIAGVAFRSVQLLEAGGHDAQLSTLSHIAAALGYPSRSIETSVDYIFLLLPDALVFTSEHIISDGDSSWMLWLFNFVDDLRREKDPRLILEPPKMNLDTRLLALLSATTETLCDELGLAHPWWTIAMPVLKQPWFVAEIENLKASALLESPIHFRKRNIFVLGNFLKRV